VGGVRVLPDRRPRLSLWIGGRPKSQRSRKRAQYVAAVQAEARKQVQGAPLGSSTIDVEIIYATRGVVLDVDNTPKRIFDALKGIVYDDVYLVDANTPETEKPSLVMLAIAQPAVTESPATRLPP